RAAAGAAPPRAAQGMAGEAPVADREVPLSTARRTIAERMLASRAATAAVTLTALVDATRLVALRTELKEALGAEGEPAPTYTDLIVKLTAAALEVHPELNARWAGDRIVLCGRIDIGVAVDAEGGLVVPVVRDVPRLSLRALAACSRDLIERARTRRLSLEEMNGGTFTVSNLGPMGVDAFTPIINAPECAILGVGRIARQPAVVEDRLVARDQVWLSLTFDHRVVDGGPAARFLERVRTCLENPAARIIL
ncbi:MAG: 2-oxo acid dehydrogenase subunit E2, partial [Candidatus Latescibacterota bacterium]